MDKGVVCKITNHKSNKQTLRLHIPIRWPSKDCRVASHPSQFLTQGTPSLGAPFFEPSQSHGTFFHIDAIIKQQHTDVTFSFDVSMWIWQNNTRKIVSFNQIFILVNIMISSWGLIPCWITFRGINWSCMKCIAFCWPAVSNVAHPRSLLFASSKCFKSFQF